MESDCQEEYAMSSGKAASKMKPQFSLKEAVETCLRLGLNSVKLGGYLIVLNSDCDVVLCGEPYVALMLLFDLESGKFIARVWNKTVNVGEAVTKEQFGEACSSFFSQGRPCLGLIEDEPAGTNCIKIGLPGKLILSRRICLPEGAIR